MNKCGADIDSSACDALVITSRVSTATQIRKQMAQRHIICEHVCTCEQLTTRLAARQHHIALLEFSSAFSGTEALAQIHESRSGLPVLALLNAVQLSHLPAHAPKPPDDFVVRPYHPAELLFRVERLLAREPRLSVALTVGPITARPEKRLVHVGQRRLRLTAREFDLLMLLMRSPGQLFTQQEIMRQIWERPAGQPNNLVPVYINRLRAKLATVGADKILQTTRGVGYMLIEANLHNDSVTRSHNT